MIEINWMVVVAFLMLGLIPLVAKMVELRIRVLHSLGFHRLAAFHQNASRPITISVRLVLVVLFVLLMSKGLVIAAPLAF